VRRNVNNAPADCTFVNEAVGVQQSANDVESGARVDRQEADRCIVGLKVAVPIWMMTESIGEFGAAPLFQFTRAVGHAPVPFQMKTIDAAVGCGRLHATKHR
jgi:hypothetical protein